MADEHFASPFDLRCSKICTRAGLSILLLSSLAISIIPMLKQAEALDALLKYVALRHVLKLSLDDLDRDPCWKILIKKKFDNKIPNERVMAELSKSYCNTSLYPSSKPESSGDPDSGLKPESSPLRKGSLPNNSLGFRSPISSIVHAQDLPPAPPTGISVGWPLWPMIDIVNNLEKLGDGGLITKARSYSYSYDLRIYRWAMRRHNTIIGHIAKGRPVVVGRSEQASGFVKSYSKKELLDNLTLQDVRSLAEYELISVPEAENLATGAHRVNIPWALTSLTFQSASTFIEAALLVSCLYFWLFLKEAQRFGSYPSPGTLFSAFLRNKSTVLVYSTLSIVPAISAVLLAVYSWFFTAWNAFFAAGICLVSEWMLMDLKPRGESDRTPQVETEVPSV
jgi:hypothetical protein